MNNEDISGALVLLKLAVIIMVMVVLIALVNRIKDDAFNNGVLAHYRGEYVVQTNLDGSLTVFPKDAIKVVP
jgi:hypothetical protein